MASEGQGNEYPKPTTAAAAIATTGLALTAMTLNAAHVLGLHDRGRLAGGLRADVTLLDAPDWRYLAYHLAGDVVAGVIRGGTLAHRR